MLPMSKRFGNFIYEARRRQVLRDNGDVLHLTPKAFDLLGVLLEAAPGDECRKPTEKEIDRQRLNFAARQVVTAKARLRVDASSTRADLRRRAARSSTDCVSRPEPRPLVIWRD